MKSTLLTMAVAASLAAAQLEDVPKCASSCITDYTTGDQIAGCGQFDVGCICGNDDFISGISCCLEDACDSDGQAAAITFAQQICATVGVDVPDTISCSSSNSTASGTTSSSPSGTESASSQTDSSGAAPEAVTPIGGIVGAAVAVLFAF